MFTILLVAASFAAIAQTGPVDRLFEKYSNKEGFTSVYISRGMFSLFAEMETDDEEFDKIFKNLREIKIISSSKSGKAGDVDFYNEVIKDLPVELYEELMVVREKDQNFRFLMMEENGFVSELLMIAGGSKNNALISIRGEIDLKSIASLSRAMNLQGLEQLENIEK